MVEKINMFRRLSITFSAALLSLLLLFGFSSSVSAIGTTINVETPIAISTRPTVSNSASNNCWFSSNVVGSNGGCSLWALFVHVGGWGTGNGAFYQIQLTINNTVNNDSLDALVYNDVKAQIMDRNKNSLGTLELFNVDASRNSNSSTTITYTFVVRGSGEVHYIYFNPNPIRLWGVDEEIHLDSVILFYKANSSNSNVESAINNLSNNLTSQVQSINRNIDRSVEEQIKQTAEVKKQTEAIEQTKDFITDDTPPSVDVEGQAPSVGWLPAGPLDSLLLMPLNLMNIILSSLGGSCSPLTVPLPFVNENLSMTCVGDVIYAGDFAPFGVLLGGVGGAVILFYYFKHLYKKVARATQLETTAEDEWGVL